MGIAAVANAQVPDHYDPTPSNVVIRVGGGFAIDQTLNNYSTSYFGGGLDFGFGKGLFQNSETYFSVDALWGSHKSTNNTFFPFAVNQRFYTDRHSSDNSRFGEKRAYGFIGLGATYYQVGGADTKPSLRGGFGVDINENLVFETTAFLAQKSKNDVTANLIGIYLGYRFR